jgi:hypothetical protein
MSTPMTKSEKWIVATNVILAAIGVVALYIYYGQLDVMRGQLGEIIKQYPEIQASTKAAIKAADQTEHAVDNAAEDFRIDARAWVGISSFVLEKHADDWSSVTCTASFQNFGKTPAINMSVRGDSTVTRFWGVPYPPPYRKFKRPVITHGDLDPSVTGTIPYVINAKDETESADIRGIKKFYYAYGKLTYSDIFGGEHWTHYCFRIAAGYPPHICESYNDSDADSKAKH